MLEKRTQVLSVSERKFTLTLAYHKPKLNYTQKGKISKFEKLQLETTPQKLDSIFGTHQCSPWF